MYKTLLFLLFLANVLSAKAGASTITLYTNITDNAVYNHTGFEVGYNSFYNANVSPAFGFTTDESAYITQINAAVFSDTIHAPETGTLSIWTNSGGATGQNLGSWPFAASPSFDPAHPVQVTGISGVHLQAGHSYFVKVSSPGSSDLVWLLNDQHSVGPIYNPLPNSNFWTAGSKTIQSAFSVLGSPNRGCLSSDPNYFRDAFVSPQTTGTSIYAKFAGLNYHDNQADVPTSCTLDDIAQAYGYNHFNFIQVATSYPSCFGLGLSGAGGSGSIYAPPPFIDPPPGGYSNQLADNYPYYYDESGQPGALPLAAQETGAYLKWNDQPLAWCEALPGTAPMSFTTSLVGVYKNEKHSRPLVTFNWTSDVWEEGGKVAVASSTPNSDAIYHGGITGIKVLNNPLDVPPDVLTLLEKQPATHVPAPSTFLLLGTGILGLFASRRGRDGKKKRSVEMVDDDDG